MPRGKYRSLVRRVSKDIMHAVTDNADVRRYKTILPAADHCYVWNRKWKTDPLKSKTAIGFDVNLKVKRRRGPNFVIYASVFEDETGNSHIDVVIEHDPYEKTHLTKMYYELVGTIRHEIEHISEEGQLAGLCPTQERLVPHTPRKGKIVHTINRRAKLFGDLHKDLDTWGLEEERRLHAAIDGDMLAYLTCYEEVGPLTQGFYYEAKKRRIPTDEVINEYLTKLYNAKLLSDAEIDEAFNHLVAWTKLTLPNAIIIS